MVHFHDNESEKGQLKGIDFLVNELLLSLLIVTVRQVLKSNIIAVNKFPQEIMPPVLPS